jgi:lipopolysaccharide/colanic/teichoic acid biosynthesis glycosyltransferase
MEASPLPTQTNLRLVDPAALPAPTVSEAHSALAERASPAEARSALEVPPARPRRERLAGGESVRPLRHPWYPSWKYRADRAIALVLAVPALLVVAVAALVVKLTSRGPAFYTQTRVGRDGRTFLIYKLRTMLHNCESLTGPRWSIPGDPRVTRFGAFLRATHLDELPQLLNVLRGEMSLIGPRPERPEFVPELERVLPAYRQRLYVRPGVTGLAQVQLPPDADLASVRRKLAHDLYYIQHLSPWLDLRLLVCTGFYALGIPFSALSKYLGIPAGDTVERAMHKVMGEPPTRLRLGA